MDRHTNPTSAAPHPLVRPATATRHLVGVFLIVALVGIGGVAALATWVSVWPASVLACYLALVLVGIVMSSEGVALRRFRRQLAALPETVHPQGY